LFAVFVLSLFAVFVLSFSSSAHARARAHTQRISKTRQVKKKQAAVVSDFLN
jgi:hypothetical protein